ncbi:nucleotidyltransferase domain-containing protein [Candidatus Woesearchaeota archaeon]|nr:nucleotidyltransferase domain-containing protein [Candidatus Woesearchaeota archaeon]
MVQETSLLLTKRELEVIDKKLKKMKLTQQDSNYLSKYIRPKLREMSLIDSKGLLSLLGYNQKIPAIEKRIKRLVLSNIKEVGSITIYGSAIYNNYESYNDIDVLVAVKKKFWEKLGEKYKLIIAIKNKAKKQGLKLDLEIYTEEAIYESYSSSITLIYQLKNSKTIYGLLKLPAKTEIYKLDLRMKTDYSIIEPEDLGGISGLELYKAIRNLWLIKLMMNKIMDNMLLNKIIEDELGKNLVNKLKNNRGLVTDKKIAYLYLNRLLKSTLNELKEAKWEKLLL